MQSKPYSKEADKETIDENNQRWRSKVTIYKNNKKKAGKKDQTIMISKKEKYNARSFALFSNNIIQYLLEGFIKKDFSIEKIRNLVEKIKLENGTLNFVVGTMDYPNILSEFFEENSRLNTVVLQANNLLSRQKHEIERLCESPV